jgi:hypothetical protein
MVLNMPSVQPAAIFLIALLVAGIALVQSQQLWFNRQQMLIHNRLFV